MKVQIEISVIEMKTSSWRRRYQWLKSLFQSPQGDSKEVSVVLTIAVQPENPLDL